MSKLQGRSLFQEYGVNAKMPQRRGIDVRGPVPKWVSKSPDVWRSFAHYNSTALSGQSWGNQWGSCGSLETCFLGCKSLAAPSDTLFPVSLCREVCVKISPLRCQVVYSQLYSSDNLDREKKKRQQFNGPSGIFPSAARISTLKRPDKISLHFRSASCLQSSDSCSFMLR